MWVLAYLIGLALPEWAGPFKIDRGPGPNLILLGQVRVGALKSMLKVICLEICGTKLKGWVCV